MADSVPEAGRDKILDISEQLFTEHGYKGVSIRMISQACNLTNAALYYHFDNKEALYAAVMEQYISRLGARMQQASALSTNPKDQLVAILREYVHVSADRRSPYILLHWVRQDLHSGHHSEEKRRFYQGILNPIETVLHEASQRQEISLPEEPLSAASLLLGMLHAHMQHRRMVSNDSISTREVQMIVEQFWFGVAQSGAEST